MSYVWPSLTFSCRHSYAVWETPHHSMCLRSGPSSDLWLCKIFCGLLLDLVLTDEYRDNMILEGRDDISGSHLAIPVQSKATMRSSYWAAVWLSFFPYLVYRKIMMLNR